MWGRALLCLPKRLAAPADNNSSWGNSAWTAMVFSTRPEKWLRLSKHFFLSWQQIQILPTWLVLLPATAFLTQTGVDILQLSLTRPIVGCDISGSA